MDFQKVILAFQPATLLKRDSNTLFSCEYCEILRKTNFEEHQRTAASALSESVFKELWHKP